MPAVADVRKRIERITKKLEYELGLDGWLDIRHIFDEGYDGDSALDNDGNATIYPTAAITAPSWKYRSAKIRWFPNALATSTDADIEITAIHEYLHILIAPITTPHHKSMTADLEEFVVESIARVVAHARGMENVH